MAKPPVDLEALLATVQAALAVRAALSPSELRLTRKHLPALRARLVALGFEVGVQVRRPLRAQLLEALASGFVPHKGIEKRVGGATAREVNHALGALVEEGLVREVVGVAGLGFLPNSAESADFGACFIEQGELAELLKRLGAAQRLVKRAVAKKGAKRRPSLLRDDLASPLLPFLSPVSPVSPVSRTDDRTARPETETSASARALNPNTDEAPALTLAPAGSTAPPDSRESCAALASKIHACAAASALPVRVPDVLRSLGVGPEAGMRALLSGASMGLYSLEPESGMARLTQDDAAFCPVGPEGSRLSWIVSREARTR